MTAVKRVLGASTFHVEDHSVLNMDFDSEAREDIACYLYQWEKMITKLALYFVQLKPAVMIDDEN